jgi:hypothetical protein
MARSSASGACLGCDKKEAGHDSSMARRAGRTINTAPVSRSIRQRIVGEVNTARILVIAA